MSDGYLAAIKDLQAKSRISQAMVSALIKVLISEGKLSEEGIETIAGVMRDIVARQEFSTTERAEGEKQMLEEWAAELTGYLPPA